MWPTKEAQRHLSPGEKLIWAERAGLRPPEQERPQYFWVGILLLAGFVFSLGGIRDAVCGDDLGAFLLIFPVAVLAVVGIALVSLPIIAYRRDRWTVYAITDERLLIIQRSPRNRVFSYEPEQLGVLERHERTNGSGDIVFRQEHHFHSRGQPYIHRVGFFGIPDVRRIEGEIRKLKKTALTEEEE